MKKLTGPLAGMGDTILSNHNQIIAKLKADSKSKYGFAQKPGFNIPWLAPARLAVQLDISPKTLERMRKDGSGPPFAKLGNKRIRYPIIGLELWLDSHMNQPIPEPQLSPPAHPHHVTTQENDLSEHNNNT